MGFAAKTTRAFAFVPALMLAAGVLLAAHAAAGAMRDEFTADLGVLEREVSIACKAGPRYSETTIQVGNAALARSEAKLADIKIRMRAVQDFIAAPEETLRRQRERRFGPDRERARQLLLQRQDEFTYANGMGNPTAIEAARARLGEARLAFERAEGASRAPAGGPGTDQLVQTALTDLESLADLSERYQQLGGRARGCVTLALAQERGAEPGTFYATDLASQASGGPKFGDFGVRQGDSTQGGGSGRGQGSGGGGGDGGDSSVPAPMPNASLNTGSILGGINPGNLDGGGSAR